MNKLDKKVARLIARACIANLESRKGGCISARRSRLMKIALLKHRAAETGHTLYWYWRHLAERYYLFTRLKMESHRLSPTELKRLDDYIELFPKLKKSYFRLVQEITRARVIFALKAKLEGSPMPYPLTNREVIIFLNMPESE